MITIVNYGVGNLGSIQNMLKKIGAKSEIATEPRQILDARKIILPGVGSFDAGMRNLKERNLITSLNEKVLNDKAPTLGICLGMQLMTRGSQEGMLPGLGWIDAEAIRFSPDASAGIKVPHMGWNLVHAAKQSPLLVGATEESRFYFVHSYYVRCNERDDVLLTASYPSKFAAGFERGNVIGVQFHPEKSHKYGIWLLTNFVERY